MEVALFVRVIVVVFVLATVVVPPILTVSAGVLAPDSSGLIVKLPLMVMAPPRVYV